MAESRLHDGGEDPLFLELVGRYLEDDLADDELAVLKDRLESDASCRSAFAMICMGQTVVGEELAFTGRTDGDFFADEAAAPEVSLSDAMVLPAIVDDGGDDEVDEGTSARPVYTPPSWTSARDHTRRWLRGGIAAAIGLVVVGGAMWFSRTPQVAVVDPRTAPSSPLPLVDTEIAPPTRPAMVNPPTAPAPAAIAGTVVDLLDVRWESGSKLQPRVGQRIEVGQSFALASGIVRVRMEGDAEVVIEGPAEITLKDGNAVSLARGQVAARLRPGASGFVVITPAGEVTDLGTEFGVAVAPDTAQTDVHVFSGSVRVASGNIALPLTLAAGDAAVVRDGAVTVIVDGIQPQRFVRDLDREARSLELADLMSGGDGLTGRRGGVIDPVNGNFGRAGVMELGDELKSSGGYQRVPALRVVDGVFMPGRNKDEQVTSAGDAFAFPRTDPATTVRICAGGKLPHLKNGTFVITQLAGVDYAAKGRSFVFAHPSVGITFDLAAIRRLHPRTQLSRFRCVVGNSISTRMNKAGAFVLVDGKARFSQERFTPDQTFDVDFEIGPNDRFLTLASVDGGDGMNSDQVLFADAVIDVVPAP